MNDRLYWLTLISGAGFWLVFSGQVLPQVDFWTLFSVWLLSCLLAGLSADRLFSRLVYGDFRENPGKFILVGMGSAVLLYFVFWLGHLVLSAFLADYSFSLSSIYSLKSGQNPWRIGIFLTLIIGPGEELWWRGFLQRHWTSRLGSWPAMGLVAALYTAVHLSTKNPVLLLAALVSGLWWGYQYLRFKSLLANVVSHVLWDLMVFIFFPFS